MCGTCWKGGSSSLELFGDVFSFTVLFILSEFFDDVRLSLLFLTGENKLAVYAEDNLSFSLILLFHFWKTVSDPLTILGILLILTVLLLDYLLVC